MNEVGYLEGELCMPVVAPCRIICPCFVGQIRAVSSSTWMPRRIQIRGGVHRLDSARQREHHCWWCSSEKVSSKEDLLAFGGGYRGLKVGKPMGMELRLACVRRPRWAASAQEGPRGATRKWSPDRCAISPRIVESNGAASATVRNTTAVRISDRHRLGCRITVLFDEEERGRRQHRSERHR